MRIVSLRNLNRVKFEMNLLAGFLNDLSKRLSFEIKIVASRVEFKIELTSSP